MREIKFRGKRKDYGYWLYGDYCSLPSSTILFISEKQTVDFERVITETVGQFTGSYDKNGKEIYEGDIVKVSYPGVKFEIQIVPKIGVVRFLDTLPQFVIMGNVEPNCVLVSSFNNTGEEWSVIGNIHDNPELLNPQ